jgi:hypothetical protein
MFTLARDISGSIWAGTNHGLIPMSQGQFILNGRLMPDLNVKSVLFDSRRNIWIGNEQGLWCISGNDIIHYARLSGKPGFDRIVALWETKDGDIWAGTADGGAGCFRGNNWTIVDGVTTHGNLGSNYILAGMEDSEQNIWFATLNGLYRLQVNAMAEDLVNVIKESRAWKTYSTAGSQVNTLWEDLFRPGNIWVGTDGGLNLIRGSLMSTFTTDDGLSDKRISALGQAPDGILWIGTEAGITYHRDAQIPPKVIISNLGVDNRNFNSETQVKEIVVSYHTKNAVLNFAGSDLGDLGGVLFNIYNGNKIVKSGITEKDNLLDLVQGSTYIFSVEAYDRHFNTLRVTNNAELRVLAPNAWDKIRDNPYFPLIILVFFVLVVLGILKLIQYIGLRRFIRFPLDLDITLKEQPDTNKFEVRIKKYKFGHKKPREDSYTSYLDLTRANAIEKQLRFGGVFPTDTLKHIGQELHSALFPEGKFVCLKKDELDRGNLRLRLRLDQSVSFLPWELIYCDMISGHLALKSGVSLVRDLSEVSNQNARSAKTIIKGLYRWASPRGTLAQNFNIASDFNDLTVKKPLKMLIVWTNPKDRRITELNVGLIRKEIKEITEGLADAITKGTIEMPLVMSLAGWEEFSDAVTTQKPDIIHFIGHCIYWLDKYPALVFHEETGGALLPVKWDLLKVPFQSTKTTKLVVLNACSSAQSQGNSGVPGMAEALVKDARLPAAIGMGYPITQDQSGVFSREFYQKLALHGQIDFAVMQARIKLADATGPERLDWGVPRLYLKVPNGIVFDLIR